MVLSKRERYIAFGTAGVLALLALDRVALSPLFARSQRVDDELSNTQVELERAQQLFANGPRMNQRWHSMVVAGLKSDVTESESQALRALHDWAQDAGLTLLSLQPDRVERARKQQDFQQLTLRASGTGSMRAVSRFLWRVQTASIPLRVTDLQVGSRKEGTDDLTVTLAVSTLVLAEPARTAAAAVAAPAAAAASGTREGKR